MTSGKTTHELESLIMSELRDNPACSSIDGVVVSPEGAPGQWRVGATIRKGSVSSPDANRALVTVVIGLKQKFHLDDGD